MNTIHLLRIPSIAAIFIVIMFRPVLAEQNWQNDIKIEPTTDDTIHIHVTDQDITTLTQPTLEINTTPKNSNLGQQFTYLLDWDLENVELNKTGPGWSVTNNLGYRIQIERGYLVNRSIELIACEHNHTAGVSSIISALFLPQPAYAGHGNTEHDTSRISRPFVETLTTPGPVELETVTGMEPAYCQMHYLIAPGIETAKNLPDDADMLNVSLFIEGTYQTQDSNTAVPFTITTDLAWGTVTDLAAGEAGLSLENQTNSVTIRRRLGALFNDVDFNEMSGKAQAKAVLRSLVKNVTITIK